MSAASEAPRSDNYTQGHSKPVVEAHGRRTAATHAAYLIPHVGPNSRILDVGCGPGSITLDFGRLAASGSVVGIDYSQEVIDLASKRADNLQPMPSNVSFQQGDVYEMKGLEHESFDVVHCHQMLLHLNASDPVRALSEMRRVCKVGGIIAAREADFESFVIYPDEERVLKRSLEVWAQKIKVGGGEPNGGRHLLEWALKAGFQREDLTINCSVETHSTAEERRAYGMTQAARIEGSHGNTLVRLGLCDEEEVTRHAEAWKEFGRWGNKGGFYGMVSMEILCVKSER